MPFQVNLSQDFVDGFEQSTETAMHNLAFLVLVEMKKLAPFARPSQYKHGYSGTPGTLVKSLKRQGKKQNLTIVSTAPYAIRRNYENNLNPQTKQYIERSISNTGRGSTSRWWQAERGA